MMRFAFLVCCLAVAGVRTGACADENRRPNILFILADDLGWGDVHANNPGACKIPTPHMDRVAEEGLTLTDMHSASAVCSPSRYALLTGRYSWRSRLQRSIVYPNMDYLIDPDRLTLPEMLNKQGYYSGIVGKWHLGSEYDRAVDEDLPAGPIRDGRHVAKGPLTQGFDYFYGAYTNGETIMIENDREVLNLPKLEDVLPLHTRKAVEFIQRRGGLKIYKRRVPFFLFFSMTSPHFPLVPSEEWKGRTGMGDYADFVAETDHSIGDVLAAIEQVGLEDETIVIVTSDHGEFVGDKGLLRHGCYTWEPVVKVPLIFYDPTSSNQTSPTHTLSNVIGLPWPRIVMLRGSPLAGIAGSLSDQ